MVKTAIFIRETLHFTYNKLANAKSQGGVYLLKNIKWLAAGALSTQDDFFVPAIFVQPMGNSGLGAEEIFQIMVTNKRHGI